MSWSIQFIGKPERVAEALTAQSEKFDSVSKIEYDAALPHLVGLVNQNFGHQYLLKLQASGGGYSIGGTARDRQLVVNLELVYGVLV